MTQTDTRTPDESKAMLIELLLEVLKQSGDQITWLIENQPQLSKIFNGAFQPDTRFNFRSAIAIIYIIGLNQGVLGQVSLKWITDCIDNGWIDESALNQSINDIYDSLKEN